MQKVSQSSEFIELLFNGSSITIIEEYLAFTHSSEKKYFLHYAVTAKRQDIIALLLKLGADIDERDANGRTALHYAVAKSHIPIVVQLLQYKAKSLLDNTNCTPLQLALRDLDTAVLITLLESYDNEFAVSLDEITNIVLSYELPDKIRYAAYLHLITKGTETQITDLARHFDFSYRDSKGRNATYLLIKAKNTKLLALGYFPLDADLVLTAIANGDAELLSLLLLPKENNGYGLSLTVLNDLGEGPIHTAIAHGQTEMLSILLKPKRKGGHGLSLDVRNKNGEGPVLTAIAHGQTDLLSILLKPKKKNGYGLSLHVENINGQGPVLTAIGNGQNELLSLLLKPKKQGGYGLSLDVCNKYESGPVLIACANGQINLLALLLSPIENGGYGMSLNVKNCHGENPVLIAIANGQIELLSILVKPKEEGGYGLPLHVQSSKGYDAVIVAIANTQIEILQILVKPKEEGGYGISINKIEPALQSTKNKNILAFISLKYFDQLLSTRSLKAALIWADSKIKKHTLAGWKQMVIDLYKKLISQYLSTQNNNDAITVYEHLNAIIPTEATLFIAKEYLMLEQHDEAFKFYLKVYNNIHSPNRQAVGFELANMIFTGSVIINTEGGLIPLNENFSMEARAKLGLNTETMMWRAITAYEYLHGNNSEEATLLRRYLDNCLKGELSVSVNSKNAWNITAMKKFKEYYSKKNLVMLTEEAYSASLNFILDNLEPEQKQPSLYSPRFVGGKAPKFENLKNDNNNHSQKL